MTSRLLMTAVDDVRIDRRAVSRQYRGWISSASAALLLVTAGCSSPPERADETASRLGLEPVSVSGGGFKHRAYVRSDVRSSVAVNVYLEGDGLPWKTRHRVAADPTPRYPLALHLAARDPTPSLLLGRPCYYGITAPGPCRPWLWTSGRYSEEVVRSMVAALKRLLSDRAGRRITLVGFSGGGVLAMLIAEQVPGIERVLTVAANLDTNAWTDLHGYSRLEGSLNPAERPILPSSIKRVHLAGELDEMVPADLIVQAAARDPGAHVRVLPGFGHRCCWAERWPELLARSARM